jgi:hypothetical protein
MSQPQAKSDQAELQDPSLPRNDEAEEALVLIMIRSTDAILDVLAVLSDPIDFYVEDYRQIFSAVLTLYDNGNVINAVTVSEELDRRRQARSRRTLDRITTGPDSIKYDHAKLYAMIVHDKAILRSMRKTTMDDHRETVVRLVDEFRSVSKDLEYEVRKRLDGVLAKYQLPSEYLCLAMRKIYWESYPVGVPEDWIRESFCKVGINIKDFKDIINNYNYEFNCNKCSKPIKMLVRDRDDVNRYFCLYIACEACNAEFNAEDLANYRKDLMEKEREEQAKKVAELRAMSYQDYLMTDHWKTVRELRLTIDGRRCRLCRSTERLQVHHSTYERRGCEEMDDLITLCGDCHQMFHEHGKLTRPV